MAIETLRSLALAAGHNDLPVPERRMSIAELDSVMDQFSGSPTFTGRNVSQRNALQVSAVWACVSVLADDIASLPLEVFRRTENGRERATDHYLWTLLQQEANPEMTSFRWKQLMQTWLLLWGNAYSEIETNGRGQVVGLWPWRPDRVRVLRSTSSGQLFYQYRMEDGTTVTRPHDRILHLRGLGVDGSLGLSPIEQHKQTVGLSMAMTEHGARFFGNGARPLGILSHPGSLSDQAIGRLRKQWEDDHQGLSRAHRIGILEEGMKYQEVGMKMVDAQYLETMNFGITDICRIFKVPPHRIAQLDRSTNNNIEHQGLEYVLYSLRPIAVNWEQEIEFALLSPRERSTVFLRYNFRELIRGDMAAQGVFYGSMINNGVLTPNDVREEIGENPLPTKYSDCAWMQGAMVPVTEDMMSNATPKSPTPPAPVQQKVNGLAVQ